MKWKTLGLSVILLATLSLYGCFNLFNFMEPRTAETETDVNILISMGNSQLYDLDYSNAYVSFKKAVDLNPTNALAIEGMCTAYLYWKIPLTNFIQMALSGNFAKITNGTADGLTTLFDVSKFMATNLERITFQSSDNTLSSNDVNNNINFFLFNTISSVFYIMDLNDNKSILNDPGDIMTLASLNPPVITNNFSAISNNFIFILKVARILPPKIRAFLDSINKSDVIIARLMLNLKSTTVRSAVSNVTTSIAGIKDQVNGLMSDFNISSDSLTNFSLTNLLAYIKITNITNISENIISFISQSGMTNYALFTNSLISEGFTGNPVDTLTNIFSDLGSDYSNINASLTNYFGVTNL